MNNSMLNFMLLPVAYRHAVPGYSTLMPVRLAIRLMSWSDMDAETWDSDELGVELCSYRCPND